MSNLNFFNGILTSVDRWFKLLFAKVITDKFILI